MSGNGKLFYQQNFLIEKKRLFFAKVVPSSFREICTKTIEFFFLTQLNESTYP